MKVTNTIIVDDHKIFRDGLKLALSTMDGIKVIKEASSGKEFLDILDDTPTDIVFMDISMPDMNGIEASKKALVKKTDLKIIMMSSYNDIEIINQAISAGISGYLLKTADYKEIVRAVKIIKDGKKYFSSDIMENITNEIHETHKEGKQESFNNASFNLTKRETEILTALCNGNDTKLIAKKFFISERTVEKHIQNIMQKTNTHSSSKLIIFAIKNNIITLN